MKLIGSLFTFILTLAATTCFGAETRITPDMALQRLMIGNQRFYQDQMSHADHSRDRREDTASLQKPFAVILGCSDSRVLPEIIFDQGIGDLFVIRVAGNVVGPLELDSIEYSVLVNGSSVIVVLGHENCGAVKAVLAKTTKDIEAIAALIEPAIAQVNPQAPNAVETAVKANVHAVVEQLKQSTPISTFMRDNKLKVVGAYYNLRTGKVDLVQ